MERKKNSCIFWLRSSQLVPFWHNGLLRIFKTCFSIGFLGKLQILHLTRFCKDFPFNVNFLNFMTFSCLVLIKNLAFQNWKCKVHNIKNSIFSSLRTHRASQCKDLSCQMGSWKSLCFRGDFLWQILSQKETLLRTN